MKLKVGMVSLGCPKNLVDSEIMLGLVEGPFEITARQDEAEVIVVNTCAFIDRAKKESVDTILSLADLKKAGRLRSLIVTGCLVERYREELLREIPEIDFVLGTGEIGRIKDVIASLTGKSGRVALKKKEVENRALTTHLGPGYIYDHLSPRVLSTPSHTAYIKIAEGCDRGCAFCIIPSLRGEHRSRPLESIVEEARRLVSRGVKEIILISQDTLVYGIDLYKRVRLVELLERLSEIEGLRWIRLLYGYPTSFSDEIIQFIAHEPKVCKYIDMPLQHVNDRVLHSMKRGGRKRVISNLIEALRSSIPGVAIRTSFIVGYPGEDEAAFEELMEFVDEVKFDRLGVFTYSKEGGTPAADLPNQVPARVKEERRKRLMALQQEISLGRNGSFIGREVDILVERASDKSGVWVGRTQYDAPEIDGVVYVNSRRPLTPGCIAAVRIVDATEYDLIGELR